ncbi:hypothetical protein BN946_scf184753.g54 [Trametes cinnabarina]|uniref:F-box domain-containing protein n=1 Tax=Pycnoporus cinnabarinus TaxID=5643 RepID=A0A060SYL4_PYCCI|nr:hypothetical protein BN946_scf184753.g54 [Trametes cinnabarina]
MYLAQSLTRPPDISDWSLFLTYSALVTSFKRFGPEPDLDQDTYRLLCLYRPEARPLLPNLRELIWEESDADVFEYAYQFLGPKLTTLHVGQPPSDSILLPILRSLHERCPLLSHLSVQCRSSIGPVDPLVSRAISRLPRLESVDLALPLFSDSILALSTLPDLAVVKVFLPRITSVHQALQAIDYPIFSTISVLQISAVELERSLRHLIRQTSSSQLTEVHLCTAHDPSASELREFLNILSSPPRKDTLTAVSISSPLPSSIPLMISMSALPPMDLPGCSLDFSVFCPLTACAELAELEVTSFFIKLDDELISLLANAFPMLQSLRLMLPYNAGKVSEVTLEGLLPLFRQCPHLIHLAVPIDATRPPRTLDDTMCPSELLSIDVADSPILFPDEVAAFLSAYCTQPSFTILAAQAHEGDRDPEHMRSRELHSALWDQVARMVRLFIRVRILERRTSQHATLRN